MEQFEEIKTLAITALVSDDYLMETLVLKGGNALDIIYKISPRASVDLDFSIESDFDETEITSIKEKIEGNLKNTFNENGYEVFDVNFSKEPPVNQPKMPNFWGGYSLEFKVINHEKFKSIVSIEEMRRNAEAIDSRQKKTFKVDISKHEWCQGKVPKELMGYTVNVYTPEMLALEKLRAICQQTKEYVKIFGKSHLDGRAKDFFDIYTIVEHFDIDIAERKNIELIKAIFAAKEVPLELLAKIEDYREHHRPDFVAVEQTVRNGNNIESYDFYFDFVLELTCSLLQALGIK